MRSLLVTLILVTSSGCASLYPIGGAILGGGAGSLAGPVGGAIGAGAGAAGGQILAQDRETTELKDQLKAITQGDVQKLIELQAGKSQSAFDKVIDGIYRVLWLLGIATALWFVLPIIWAKWHVKKTIKQHVEILNGNTK